MPLALSVHTVRQSRGLTLMSWLSAKATVTLRNLSQLDVYSSLFHNLGVLAILSMQDKREAPNIQDRKNRAIFLYVQSLQKLNQGVIILTGSLPCNLECSKRKIEAFN